MSSIESDRPDIDTGRRASARGRSGAPIPDAVFRATEELLAEGLLQRLTVSRILARASVSRTSFYYHFPSKDAVLVAMLEQVAAHADAQIAQLSDRQLEADAAIRVALEASVELWERHSAILLVAQGALRDDSELGEQWRTLVEERFVRPFAERLRRQQAAGRLAAGHDPLALSRALHWMTEQALYAHIAGTDRTPPRIVVDALAHVWSASLGR
ncbi:TetR/AcrR family transcriptional regulator [Conexibacter sp. CPCC 206217]|uniref:TetR/AcrR family transcriptional regulator n=1 Tax=Conexibacter sp. CPCC 206217 TaxID=3064574 RepID=UPI0027211390|nr:TetR/AcrR family transcriptional regulator [Conexibacter sp. CPCC 206217]MDO8209688.1 helix-turn-helix domain-containing protein [Conexibacter sp. CPCC 206217]